MEVELTAAPREILVLLEEAEERIKNEQWSEATFTLGILLGLEEARRDDFTGVDFFITEELWATPLTPAEDIANCPAISAARAMFNKHPNAIVPRGQHRRS